MFDINGGEFIVLIVVAIIVIGPERLPGYAAQLGGWIRSARTLVREAKIRVDAELGEQANAVDWAALDPRRYDPRRIVREALLDNLEPTPREAGADLSHPQPSLIPEPIHLAPDLAPNTTTDEAAPQFPNDSALRENENGTTREPPQ